MGIPTIVQERLEPGRTGERPTAGPEELTDAGIAHALRRGVGLGVPGIRVVVVWVVLLATGPRRGLTIADVPALFAGPYFGVIVSLTLAERRAELGATIHPMPRLAEPATRRQAA